MNSAARRCRLTAFVRALALLTAFFALLPGAFAATFESTADLLEQVRDTQRRERERLAAQEQRFLAAQGEQRSLVAEATVERQRIEREADRLLAEYRSGEQELGELEAALATESGDLDEVFSTVRQAANDARTLLTESLTRIGTPSQQALLDELAGPDAVPSTADLRQFWTLFLEEMHASGEVARVEAPIVGMDGRETSRPVTRIGTFTAVSDGQFLRHLPESGRLLQLAAAPGGQSPAQVRAFADATTGLLPIAIDPSRGAILAMVTQRPDLTQRIRQGGVIGYLILAIGLIGLLIALERMIRLLIVSRRVNESLAGRGTQHDLAALQTAAADPHLMAQADGLSARIDEIITGTRRRLGRGISAVAIFAAVSPLLGLLGTVTGMIETFQVITLFGAGDPRLMSGGISQALVTTQLGLCVAIPLLLLHSFVTGRLNEILGQLDEYAARLLAGIAGNRDGSPPRGEPD